MRFRRMPSDMSLPFSKSGSALNESLLFSSTTVKQASRAGPLRTVIPRITVVSAALSACIVGCGNGRDCERELSSTNGMGERVLTDEQTPGSPIEENGIRFLLTAKPRSG